MRRGGGSLLYPPGYLAAAVADLKGHTPLDYLFSRLFCYDNLSE